MTKILLIEQFHLSVFVPRGLGDAAAAAICRTLGGAGFRAALRRAIQDVFRRYPALRHVRVTLTR